MPDLPEEVLLLIVSHLDTCDGISYFQWHDGQRHGTHEWWREQMRSTTTTLLSLCLVNRSFARLAQPALYTSFQIPWWGCSGSAGKEFIDGRRMGLLARTLASNASLAALVKNVRIVDTGYKTEGTGSWEHKVVHATESALLQVLVDAASATSLPADIKHGIVSGLSSGSPLEAMIALLLASCEKVGTLSMTWWPRDESLVLKLFRSLSSDKLTNTMGKAGSCSANFLDLKELTLIHRPEMNPLLALTCQEVLAFPFLHTFRGTVLWLPQSVTNLPTSTTLKTLDLALGLVHVPILAHLLKACPALQHLDIHWVCEQGKNDVLDSGSVGEAIRENGRSLQSLVLDGNIAHISTLSTLRPLSSLNHLQVPADALVEIPRPSIAAQDDWIDEHMETDAMDSGSQGEDAILLLKECLQRQLTQMWTPPVWEDILPPSIRYLKLTHDGMIPSILPNKVHRLSCSVTFPALKTASVVDEDGEEGFSDSEADV